ncbi:MAG TPA: WecB/TagA/CpsF family glycosyltransferase [Clostridiales bacterium]|nr:WecB/TagA/CpsF family glycosyltransferase [Clostridiales bacterium]
MRNTINILGIPVDNITMSEALKIVNAFLNEDYVHTIFTPNSEIMMAAQRDKELKNILINSNMLIADGAGVVLASKILGRKLPERVAGYDLVENIFSILGEKGLKFYLLGAKPGVAEAAAINIISKHKGVEISGYHHGYFSKEENDRIIAEINSSGADILLVALGAPRQEKWIQENKDKLKVKICIGVGGSLDGFAGKVPRAPDFFRKHNLEWLYRLYKEPRRFWRMLDIPRFLFLVLKSRFSHSR